MEFTALQDSILNKITSFTNAQGAATGTRAEYIKESICRLKRAFCNTMRLLKSRQAYDIRHDVKDGSSNTDYDTQKQQIVIPPFILLKTSPKTG